MSATSSASGSSWVRRLPWIFAAAIYVAVLWVDFNHKFWNTEERVIFWDVKNYYAYLPAAVIYGDIGMNFKDEDPAKFGKWIWVIPTEKGKYVNKMSMGLSFAYAPFFLPAHWLAPMLGYEADGYSVPYKFALVMSSGIYLLLGMIFLILLLRRWFGPWTIALTLTALTVGTNLFFYSTIEAAMSHAYSFALFAAFLLLTVKWHERPQWWITVLVGILAGWISLIRPTNIIIVLVFILWGVTNFSTFKTKISLLLRRWPQIVLITLMAALVWLPQLLYWKYVTGSWIYYSYGDEGFFFSNPAIMEGLFSYRKGWLVYTPVMIFALVGVFMLRKRVAGSFIPILVFIPLNIYIVLSWWSWWYGGSFGLRAFIDSYAILAIPMAAMLHWMLTRKIWLRIPSILIILLLVFHSIFQTVQYYYGAIHWDSMTKAAYWETFLKSRPTERFYTLLESPNTLEEEKADRLGEE